MSKSGLGGIDISQMHDVDIPRALKGKITEYGNAVAEYAFIGMKAPEDHAGIIEGLQIARYNLEQTINTHLIRAKLQDVSR